MSEFAEAAWRLVSALLICAFVYLGIAKVITWTSPWHWNGLPVPYYRWPLAAALACLVAPPAIDRVHRWLS